MASRIYRKVGRSEKGRHNRAPGPLRKREEEDEASRARVGTFASTRRSRFGIPQVRRAHGAACTGRSALFLATFLRTHARARARCRLFGSVRRLFSFAGSCARERTFFSSAFPRRAVGSEKRGKRGVGAEKGSRGTGISQFPDGVVVGGR